MEIRRRKLEVWLGPAPPEEKCAQLGTPNYEERAISECTRYIKLIRETIGREPEGAELVVRECPHDFGTYYEVCLEHDGSIECQEYAYDAESHGPLNWEENDD